MVSILHSTALGYSFVRRTAAPSILAAMYTSLYSYTNISHYDLIFFLLLFLFTNISFYLYEPILASAEQGQMYKYHSTHTTYILHNSIHSNIVITKSNAHIHDMGEERLDLLGF